MKDPFIIVKRPLVTEKSIRAAQFTKYCFEVDLNANKIEIGQAVEAIYKVNVVKVNTLRVKGKKKRLGRYPEGRTPDWKKAFVTLKPGQRIEILEGM